MSENIRLGEKSVTGNLADDPHKVTTNNGRELTVMRVLENNRQFDREQQQWVDGATTGYDVAVGHERLADNAVTGLQKGDRVTVRGDYQVGSYTNRDGSSGLNHRLWARDVSASMFNDRMAAPGGERNVGQRLHQDVEASQQQERVDGVDRAESAGHRAAVTSGFGAEKAVQTTVPSVSQPTSESRVTHEQLFTQQINGLPTRPGRDPNVEQPANAGDGNRNADASRGYQAYQRPGRVPVNADPPAPPAPTPEQRREVADRQQRAAESWAAVEQGQPFQPQSGLGGPSM